MQSISGPKSFMIRYNKFNKKINEDTSIEKYFNINDRYHIYLEKKDENLLFTLSYIEDYNYDIKNLPNEICNFIMSFLKIRLIVKINISFPEDYPFKNPIWSIISVETNINKSLNLNEYFQHLIYSQNCQNKCSWSPAIDIEKDILIFITRINNAIFQT
jgi:hypothetical protein